MLHTASIVQQYFPRQGRYCPAVQQNSNDERVSYARGMANVQTFGFGARLKQARIDAGFTQTEVAAIAGENGDAASKQTVSGWEAERHYPKANQLRALCLKLNISPDDLLLGDIRENLKLIQAESVIQALSPAQKEALLARLLGPAAPDSRVSEFIDPAPFDELHSDFGGLEPASGPGSYKKVTPIPEDKRHAARKRGI